jgi:antitoxin YefM
MKIYSYTTVRQNLKSVCDDVVKDHQPAYIQRKNGDNVVMLSEEDYNSLHETAYLLSSPKNKEILQKSLKNIKQEAHVFHSLDELDNAL